MVFDGVPCNVCTYTVNIWYQRNYILVSERIYNKNLSSQCSLTAQIEPVQDKTEILILESII